MEAPDYGFQWLVVERSSRIEDVKFILACTLSMVALLHASPFSVLYRIQAKYILHYLVRDVGEAGTGNGGDAGRA